HAHLRIKALGIEAPTRVELPAKQRQMVEAVIKGERVLRKAADVVPARAILRTAGKVRRHLIDWNPGWEVGPPLIHQRNAAGSEPWGEDEVESVGLRAVGDAGSGDAEEVVIDHIQVVARGEAVGGIQDVGLAPTDELLAGFDGDLAARPDGAHPPDGEWRAGRGGAAPNAMQAAVRPVGGVRLRL